MRLWNNLGIILSNNLFWSNHYDHICHNAYRSLYLIHCSFSSTLPVNLKKQLYLSLVRSHLTYCSQIWRPRLVKDILSIECVQRHATKYILHYSNLDYQSRLVTLKLLPLMYWLELQDVLFLIKCLKDENDTMNIYNYITFTSSLTRSHNSNKLPHNYCRTSTSQQFYFNRVVLLQNTLPSIDLTLSIPSIKCQLSSHMWNHFIQHLDQNNSCLFHYVCQCANCYNLSRIWLPS